MKILVCLKDVPARDTRFEVDASGRWINERSVSSEASECDEYALEEALKLREAGGGEVVILSLGSTRSEKTIRKGLAMGADRALLILDEGEFSRSPYSVAAALAAAARLEGFDLVLTGTQSDDLGWAQTGVMLAELLQVAHASLVMKIEEDQPEAFKVLREMESGWFQWLQLSRPAVLTVQAGISSIRYVSLKGIMQAKSKEIRHIPLGDLNLDLDGSPSLQIDRVYVPEVKKRAVILEGDPSSAVDQLVERLRQEAGFL